jgi:hypothetical protein
MNGDSLTPALNRAHRIRELEQLADSQRERLLRQMHDLADSFRPLEAARAFAPRLLSLSGLALRFFGRSSLGFNLPSLLAALGIGAAAPQLVTSRKFPWRAALAAGVAAVRVYSWWRKKRREG